MDITSVALYGPAAAPFAGAVLAALLPRRTAAFTSVLAAIGVLASGIALAGHARGGTAVTGSLVRADALTAWLVIAVGAVATVACWAGVHHLRDEARAGGLTAWSARRYLVLVQLFLTCMGAAVLAANVGVLWVAVEATTIVTAFLVGHRRTRASVEAAWKYVVLCSVGVGIAFLGTVCVSAAARATGAGGLRALDWVYLNEHAASLDPALMRLAAGLVLLGFGTKAGLAPMHAWLPDAHSQAPAPVSALMSGVLLSVAFYAILRYKAIFDACLGPGYARTLLLVAAMASLALAALLLIGQRDYKRLLAYSSIEHMGLIALGTAIGGRLALAAVLLHILGHGLAKSVAFCGAGQLLHRVGSPLISAVRGAITTAPATAGLFGLAVVALLGLPPFALFAAELGQARAGFAAGYGWAVTIGFLLVLVAFSAIARHGAGMLLGSPDPQTTVDTTAGHSSAAAAKPYRTGLSWVPLAVGLLAAATLGIWLGPLRPVLDSAALIAAGH
ncbi:MAG TPA: proton-conducting transporter membrane subunit [Micromonosporaceae bacterium]|jgi:hydrogenase-4 component F